MQSEPLNTRERGPLATALVVLLALAIAACGGKAAQTIVTTVTTPGTTVTQPGTTVTVPGTTTAPGTTTTAPATMDTVVYLVRGEHVQPVLRSTTATKQVLRAAIESLLAGPTSAEQAAGFNSTIPAGTQLRKVSVSGGVATIDLTRTYESGGGSLSMQLRLGQLVYTATRFPTVTGIHLLLDGKAVGSIGGEGLIIPPAAGRAYVEGSAPAILPEDPAWGGLVRCPVRVRGSSNVFEAMARGVVVGPGGVKGTATAVQATSGTGTRGTFDVQLPCPVGVGSGDLLTIRLWEPSAKDGSVTNRVDVQVAIAP